MFSTHPPHLPAHCKQANEPITMSGKRKSLHADQFVTASLGSKTLFDKEDANEKNNSLKNNTQFASVAPSY